jgi:hypothetical protein
MEKNRDDRVPGIDGYLFRLIATFEAAAMQQLGKIAHPVTGDVEVDLAGASDSIEMLAAIQRKTEGNLNADEKRLLEHVLYQIRMNYVDVAREEEQKQETAGEGGGEGAGDGSGESAGGDSGESTGGDSGESTGGDSGESTGGDSGDGSGDEAGAEDTAGER